MLDNLSGKYKVEMKTPIGYEKAILTLKVIGDRLQGTIDSDNIYSEFFNGIVENNTFKFKGKIKKILLNFEYEAVGRLKDGKLIAEITTKYGVFYASGVKI